MASARSEPISNRSGRSKKHLRPRVPPDVSLGMSCTSLLFTSHQFEDAEQRIVDSDRRDGNLL